MEQVNIYHDEQENDLLIVRYQGRRVSNEQILAALALREGWYGTRDEIRSVLNGETDADVKLKVTFDYKTAPSYVEEGVNDQLLDDNDIQKMIDFTEEDL